MPETTGARSDHFPAIERKYGQPMSHWFALLEGLGEARYEDQMAFLRDQHGFSRAHANAVVMQHRGSTTSRRYSSVDELLSSLDAPHERLTRQILARIQQEFSDLEVVVAWNQPMVRSGTEYVLGVSSAKNHLTIGPWGDGVMEAFAPELSGLVTNKKTFQVPLDWEIDGDLLCRIVQFRLDELA